MCVNHKLMISAVYLDPRYNFLLTQTQKNTAVEHLIDLWNRMRWMDPVQVNVRVDDENDDFANYLLDASTNEVPRNAQTIEPKIRSFLNKPSISYKTNIIEYWDSIRTQEPELFKLTTLLFAILASQASVEQCFSNLTYIFNNYRARLGPESSKQVLILRLNFDLLKKRE